MKGITPVVAVILLLMITIVIIGFATGFFQQVIATTGEGAVGTAERTTEQYQKIAQFVGAGDDGTDSTVTVQSVGATDIPVGEVAVLIDGVAVSCSWEDTSGNAITGDITGVGICIATGVLCPTGHPVTVSSPGMQSSGKCV